MAFNPYPDYDCIKCGDLSRSMICQSCQEETKRDIANLLHALDGMVNSGRLKKLDKDAHHGS